jgi:hypothetical protein
LIIETGLHYVLVATVDWLPCLLHHTEAITSPSLRRVVERGRSQQGASDRDGSDNDDVNDRTPLISGAQQYKGPEQTGYGLFRVKFNTSTLSAGSEKPRRQSTTGTPGHSFPKSDPGYDVNNPPSMPGSPTLGAHYEDVMVDEANFLTRSPDSRRNLASGSKDVLIDIDGNGDKEPNSVPPSPRLRPGGLRRHRSTTMTAEADVCFPAEDISEAGDLFERSQSQGQYMSDQRRRRREREKSGPSYGCWMSGLGRRKKHELLVNGEQRISINLFSLKGDSVPGRVPGTGSKKTSNTDSRTSMRTSKAPSTPRRYPSWFSPVQAFASCSFRTRLK